MTALRHLRKVHRKLCKLECSGCQIDLEHHAAFCPSCAANSDDIGIDMDDASNVIREEYARTLAGIYRDIQRGRITEALERLDRGVLAELDSAWRTLA